MPRPKKFRKVAFLPESKCFIPLGKPKCGCEEISLRIEELEAMRLKDIENLSQEECAKRMEISRQTYQNIIDEARRKVTRVLTEGHILNIEGGNYITGDCEFKCSECGNIYNPQREPDKDICPSCGATTVFCMRKKACCNKANKEKTI
jgi:predicted DNA-binding protein (UPF0251 family)